VKFTPAMEAAYRRGYELRKKHGPPWPPELPIVQPPDDVLSEYTDRDDRSAFAAGWIDASQDKFSMGEVLRAFER
jgi:hypothetical protein